MAAVGTAGRVSSSGPSAGELGLGAWTVRKERHCLRHEGDGTRKAKARQRRPSHGVGRLVDGTVVIIPSKSKAPCKAHCTAAKQNGKAVPVAPQF